MKKFLYLAILGIVTWSCGGGGDDPAPVPPAANNAPTTPTTIYPENNDLCIDNTVNFQWNASTDADGDAISYVVEVSENSSFSPLSQTKTTSATSVSISLEKGVAFYWRVRAKDSEDSSGNSSANQFYTEGDGISNHVPFAPVLVSPELNGTIQTATTTLEWTATDLDTEDTLTFDVYFGTDANPTTKVGDNITATTFDVTTPTAPNYYWKVVAKDGNGGQTVGQVWNFKVD
ncbi:hypothetical protein ACFQ5N_11805 [Lutibacter holmesii]|uniref:Fibronectin type-III domain-containing protein n=1 Tax=Lutibacter holmesii TaxID=1137985 RepID=A0ABW3WTA9_9FLAO